MTRSRLVLPTPLGPSRQVHRPRSSVKLQAVEEQRAFEAEARVMHADGVVRFGVWVFWRGHVSFPTPVLTGSGSRGRRGGSDLSAAYGSPRAPAIVAEVPARCKRIRRAAVFRPEGSFPIGDDRRRCTLRLRGLRYPPPHPDPLLPRGRRGRQGGAACVPPPPTGGRGTGGGGDVRSGAGGMEWSDTGIVLSARRHGEKRGRRLAADRASRPPCWAGAGRARPAGAGALPAGQHAGGPLAGPPAGAPRPLHLRAGARAIEHAAGRSAPTCGARCRLRAHGGDITRAASLSAGLWRPRALARRP